MKERSVNRKNILKIILRNADQIALFLKSDVETVGSQKTNSVMMARKIRIINQMHAGEIVCVHHAVMAL